LAARYNTSKANPKNELMVSTKEPKSPKSPISPKSPKKQLTSIPTKKSLLRITEKSELSSVKGSNQRKSERRQTTRLNTNH